MDTCRYFEFVLVADTIADVILLGCVADPDSGSGVFLTPGSGIRNRFFPDPGSHPHIFGNLMTIFWVESSIILCKVAQIFFFTSSKLIPRSRIRDKHPGSATLLIGFSFQI
jgi:hypothetical protein